MSLTEHENELLAKCGEVSVEEALQIRKRYNASHFRNHRDMGEHARYSIPADYRRDDDLRLDAFIARAKQAFERIALLETAAGVVETLTEADGFGFNELVEVIRRVLDKRYPADIFTGESGDKGPGFVRRVRDAISVLEQTGAPTMESAGYSRGRAEERRDVVAFARVRMSKEKERAWIALRKFTDSIERDEHVSKEPG